MATWSSHIFLPWATEDRRQLRLGRYLGLYRQRRALAELDAHRLDDIGLTRAEAEAEARRPIWDPPAHWLR